MNLSFPLLPLLSVSASSESMQLAKPAVLGFFSVVGFLLMNGLNELTEESNKCQKQDFGSLDKKAG